MIDKRIKEMAEKLYIYSSFSCQKISEELGVKRRIISDWIEKNGWMEKREEHKKRKDETLYNRILSYIESSTTIHLQSSALAAKDCAEFWRWIDSLPVVDRNKNISLMSKYSMIQANMARVHKLVTPEFNDQMGGKILDELKALNKEFFNKKNILQEQKIENRNVSEEK